MTYLQPVLFLLFLLIAYGLAFHNVYRSRRLAWIALILMFLWAWPPFAWLFSGTLEWFYQPGHLPPPDAEAIVVLSGAVVGPKPSVPEPYVAWDTYRRCKYAAWLYRHWRAVPVIASGGPTREHVTMSVLMRAALQAEGVPAGSISTEEHSSSTYENGAFTARILRSRGMYKIVLVTEAHHMLRSEKVFRKQGLDVFP